MPSQTTETEWPRDLVLGVTPFGEPSARLVAGVCRAGGFGVLDLGADDLAAREALGQLREWRPGAFGVRVAAGSGLAPSVLSDVDDHPGESMVDTVVLGWDAPWQVADLAPGRRVLVEITTPAEAMWAARAGAHGVIARGNEAGGRVGELSSFVLLQRVLAEPEFDLPVWLCGGIGPHTAAAAVAGGAAGVVLDAQFALLPECDELPTEVVSAVRAADDSDTVVLDGQRVLRRHDEDRRAGPDLGARLLPLGQESGLARRFADRYRHAGRAVHAVRESILAAVRAAGVARASRVLQAGSGFCQAVGAALPIAQGPMTRVSDQPAFAASVARHGGMPFVALALAGPAQSRLLLAQVGEALAERPWGVGVLGFAPPDLLAAQFDAIRAARPGYAIVAGGRPGQAAELERAGIRTFLHVPSPRLLRQFLDAGARRFVFEGSECGGHVGPRASFPLWEAQIAVLLDFLADQDDPAATGGELQVLFAGGVHDARSAAMVAAAAGPLTDHGVGVGLLLGSAYLFTDEAVRDGAIRPLFQRQLLAAHRTELLETAPGHATRCLSSPFTAEFQALREELRARGAAERQVWAELERLNVGRLRIASKGQRRESEGLVAIGEDEQWSGGLFMAGQVAVLRSELTTIADLHRSVTGDACDFLADRARELRPDVGEPDTSASGDDGTPLDVAIVGMAGMFPQAPDLPTFWANVLGGVDSVTEVPPQRWDREVYFAAAGDGHPPDGRAAAQRTPSKWGGFLPEIPFDPLRYGIPPSSLASIEPVQLLALEAAARALADAGYADGGFDRSRTSVVFGAEAGSDLSNATALRTVLPAYFGSMPPRLDAQLPEITEDTFPGQLANVIAGRIANRLDLGGANYTVDAACASSLAAVDLACKELAAGTSDLVLCGGADLHNGVNDYLLFSSVRALSPTGKCRTFDHAADGTVLGEGVACVVLKRLADAERDGDRVYAVIKGVGSGSDGKSLGLTAPRPEGQRRALDRAYRMAGLSPADVGLVEAHGTGTVVGDRTELATLTELFTEAGAGPGGCTIGSVKSQIGHTKCAAGLAGLIKTALALHTATRPPTLHVSAPNQGWPGASSPFAFAASARPWPAPAAQRVAGVSAFGFGGTNFHVVLAGHGAGPEPRHAVDQWPAELFTFRGADFEAAARHVRWLLDLVRTHETHGRPWRLRDLAAASARRADGHPAPVRIAVVATDIDHLTATLGRALDGDSDPANGLFRATMEESADPGKVAVLFPGQGSQRPGMLAELFTAFPATQRYLRLGRRWADVMFPPAAFGPDALAEQEHRLRDTRAAQPALGVAGLAMHHLLTRLGVRADLLGGHSYGELVALCAAGSFDPATLLRLSSARADAMLGAAGADPGTMAAVSATADDVDAVLRTAGLAGAVVIANHNAPRQVVVSGPTGLVDRAVDALRAAELAAKKIPVACAFHSPVLGDAPGRFAETLAAEQIRPPRHPVWSNRTAAPYPEDSAAVAAELAAQLGAPVRFVDQITSMYADGARVFVEAGPGTVLGKLVDDILGDRPHVTVSCGGSGDLPGFLTAVAQLAVAGVPVRTGWLFTGRAVRDVGGRPPVRPGWTVDGQLVRTVDGAYLPGGLRPAERIPIEEVVPTEPNRFESPAEAGRHALVSEFLQSSRNIVAAQRDVLLGLFGAPPQPAQPAQWPPASTPEPQRIDPMPPELSAPAPAPDATPQSPGDGDRPSPDVPAIVSSVIAERTGYPVDMIEPGLDLEADLSIDSIKRAEIVGDVVARLANEIPALAGLDLDELAKLRTTQALVDWLVPQVDSPVPVAEPPGTRREPATESAAADLAEDVVGVPPKRFLLTGLPSDPPRPATAVTLAGCTIALVGGADPAVRDRLTAGLTAYGATVVTRGVGGPGWAETREPVDGVIYLDLLADDSGHADLESAGSAVPSLFSVFQELLAQNPRWLFAVAPGGQTPAALRYAGMRGMFRTLVREYPHIVSRLIEVDHGGDPERIAGPVLDELFRVEQEPVVLTGADRRTPQLVPTPLGESTRDGAAPSGDGAAEAAALGLRPDSVLLLVGGARGITARFARLVSAASRCRVELVGSTPPPAEPLDPVLATATDLAGMRAALAGLGHRSPDEIDRLATRLLKQREVADTVTELRATAGSVRYHCVDVRDADALRHLVKEVYAEHGRLDGIVYAAGVIEDRLIADKDPDSFTRVFDTKVAGLRALLTELAELPDGPRFLVQFGSIAAVLGNRGQVDYAAANDALDTIGAAWAERTGRRVLTVHWGPWAPTTRHRGMVSPELARSYARRGVELIDPEAGALGLLRELAWGPETVRSVVYTASGW